MRLRFLPLPAQTFSQPRSVTWARLFLYPAALEAADGGTMQEDIEGFYMVCPDCGGRHFLGKNKIVALVKAFCFWHLKVPDRYADIHDGHQSPNVLYLVKL